MSAAALPYSGFLWLSDLTSSPRGGKAHYAEIERLKEEPVEDWELEKVHMKLRRQHAHDLYSTRYRATVLAHYCGLLRNQT